MEWTKINLERSCNDKRRNLSEQEKMRTSSLQQDLKLSRRVTLCFNIKSESLACSDGFWNGIRVVAVSAESSAPAISWNLSQSEGQKYPYVRTQKIPPNVFTRNSPRVLLTSRKNKLLYSTASWTQYTLLLLGTWWPHIWTDNSLAWQWDVITIMNYINNYITWLQKNKLSMKSYQVFCVADW